MTWRLIHADCLEAMAEMEEASVDAIVTDPPYGLEFMGKEWDRLGRNSPPSFEHSMQDGFKGFKPLPRPGGLTIEGMRASQEWHYGWAHAALRVLKPGGHLLAFGGTRTYHRLACAVEDAGFEIRDCLAWMYGSGFPKSLDVSKAIDKAAGAEREVIGQHERSDLRKNGAGFRNLPGLADEGRGPIDLTAPATPEAQRWKGWGTALKPAFEPIVLARKPLVGSVASNVQAYGTGALNIDAARIEAKPRKTGTKAEGDMPTGSGATLTGSSRDRQAEWDAQDLGRWPANVVLDPEAAALLDEQTGELKSPASYDRAPGSRHSKPHPMAWGEPHATERVESYGDTGGASRFFRVVAEGDNGPCLLDGILSGCQRWWDMPVSPAGGGSKTSDPTDGATAPLGAAPPSNGRPAPDAPSAVPLCGSCVTAIARSVAAISAGSDPASALGPGSTSDPRRRILIRSLALLAEAQGNTAITSTTPSLSLWCGFVARAIDGTTSLGNDGASTASAPMRLRYQAKADREERDRGLEHRDREKWTDGREGEPDNPRLRGQTERGNPHPTVKPVELMRWLCKLVTPPGGLILDPFTGSGSTGIAALREGFDFVGIEREADYVEIARDRIIGDAPLFNVGAEI